MYSYSFDPIAAIEYEEAFLWYMKRSTHAADGFQVAVEEAIFQITQQPRQYRIVHNNTREVILKRYPFSVFFLFDESKGHILIVSVFHHRRLPNAPRY